MRKIGLFAGVFDPIHLGHTSFIEQSIKDKNLDKIYVLIERQPKFKTCHAGYSHRKKMAALAISNIPQAEIYESKAAFFPITSSLPDIKKAEPTTKLYLLLGDDVAGHIKKWQNYNRLLKDVELIVAQRGKNAPYSEASSLKIRDKIKSKAATLEIDPKVLNYCRENNLYLA